MAPAGAFDQGCRLLRVPPPAHLQVPLYGSRIVVADRWYPSSKTYSCCGVVKETMALSQRTYCCDDCGFEADRDINTALTLARYAASSAASACGEARSGTARKSL
jgi:putative transposase